MGVSVVDYAPKSGKLGCGLRMRVQRSLLQWVAKMWPRLCKQPQSHPKLQQYACDELVGDSKDHMPPQCENF